MRISDWSSDVCSSDLSGAETVTTDKTTQPVTRTVASSLEQIPSLLVPRLRIYAALLHSNCSQSFPNLSSCGSMRRDLGKMISGAKRPRSAGPMRAYASRAARLTRILMSQKDEPNAGMPNGFTDAQTVVPHQCGRPALDVARNCIRTDCR